MSVLCSQKGNQGNILYVKGAPDYILKDCNMAMNGNGQVEQMSSAHKQAIQEQIQKMAEKGLRTLLMSYKTDLGALSSYDGPNHKAHKYLEDTDSRSQSL